MKKILLLSQFFLLFIFSNIIYSLDELSEDDIYNILYKSTAKIVIQLDNGVSLGSGFLFDQDGYIGTNYHVIKSSYEKKVPIFIFFASTGDKVYKANIVAVSDIFDFAVLKINLEKADLLKVSPIKIGNSDNIKELNKIYISGFPAGGAWKIAEGKIQARQKTKNSYLFDISIKLDPGNSGGPLVNSRGEVIGINTMKFVGDQKQFENFNFSIPINDIKKILEKYTIISSDSITYKYDEIKGKNKISIDDIVYLGYLVYKIPCVDKCTSKFLCEPCNKFSKFDFSGDLGKLGYDNFGTGTNMYNEGFIYYYLFENKIYEYNEFFFGINILGQCIKVTENKYYKVTKQSSFLSQKILQLTTYKSYEYFNSENLSKSTNDSNIIKIYDPNINFNGIFGENKYRVSLIKPFNPITNSDISNNFMINDKVKDDKTFIYKTVSRECK